MAAMVGACLALLALTPAQARQEYPLPTDPALIEGGLRSGMRYLIRPTGEGDPVVIRVLIPAGAIHEPAGARGLAEVVNRLASRLDRPGGIDPEALGPGVTHESYITLDAAHFMVRIDAPTPERLDGALRLLAQPFEARAFAPADLEREVRDAGARFERFDTPDSRVQRALLERLRLERIAERLPAPGVDAAAVTVDAAQAFHRGRYVAGSAAVIAVGGVDPDDLTARIERAFADLPEREAPALDWRPAPYDRPFAAVVTDPDLADCDVDLVAIAPETGPARTIGEFRRETIRAVALRALGRRLADGAASGAPYDDGTAHLIDLVGLVRIHNAFVSGAPEEWEAMLGGLIGEVRRVRSAGFDPVEIERAGDDLLAELRRAHADERKDPAGRIASRLAFAVSTGRAPMTLDQRIDQVEGALSGLFTGDVADAVAELFDPARIAYTVSIPEGAGKGLTGERVLEAALAVEGALAPARAGADAPAPVAPPVGPAGAVASITLHPASGVLTARLTNNATAHHRRMEGGAGLVHVTVTLAGGRIEECATTRGLTDAAALALARPAMRTLSSEQVRDLLARLGATLEARPSDDAVTLRLTSRPDALEPALRTLAALLAEARVEPGALDAWRRARLRDARERGAQPFDALREAVPSLLFARDEVRVRPLAPAEVEGITLERTQAWLDRLLASAPIEIGVAGPVEREAALEMLAATLGALPARDPIGSGTLDDRRAARRAAPPFVSDIVLESDSDQALVLLACFVPDADHTREAELLDIGAGALRLRLERLSRGRPGLIYPMTSHARPARVYPGVGLLYAIGAVTADHFEEFDALLAHEWREFTEDGPEEELVLAARASEARRAGERLADPGEWADLLASLTYRERDLDEALGAPERLAGVSVEAVREAVRRAAAASPAVRLTIRAEPARRPARPN